MVSIASSRCLVHAPLALVEDIRLVLLLSMQDVIHKLFTNLRCEPCKKFPRELSLLIERDAEAETKLALSSKSELLHAGPRPS